MAAMSSRNLKRPVMAAVGIALCAVVIMGLVASSSGTVLAPGEEVAVYFGVVFNGSRDISVASGHVVDYRRGERSFRELFESQLVICQVEPCEPAELLQG